MQLGRRLILASLAVACVALVLPGAAGAKQRTVWLCKPGTKSNPCKAGHGTTLVSPSGEVLGAAKGGSARKRRIDCFYVYPTVSDQPTANATLEIDPEQRSIALYQAARYSRVCRVFAPIYRQATLAAIFAAGEITEETRRIAYADIRRAWRTYLERHNRGRGVVLIGHSQGTFMLKRLLSERIEPRRSAREKLVSAILLGGDVTVKAGRDAGGDFKRIRACRARTQLRCVVAFATFNDPVPADSLFGRTTDPGLEVLCTNPAALGGGSGRLRSIYPSAPFAPGTTIGLATGLVGAPTPAVATPWYEFRGAYTGRCSSADGANVLQIAGVPGAPKLSPFPDPTWGLHLVDANIALGNLTKLIRKQAKAFVEKRRG